MKKKYRIFSGVLLFLGVRLFQIPDTGSYAQNSPAQMAASFEGFSMEDAVINVADTVGNAVVSISTEQTRSMRGRNLYFDSPLEDSPFGQDEVFRRFFDEFLGEVPQRQYKQMGLGSGVVIDSEGHILTNQHVINSADKITVTLSDGRVFNAQLKGEDLRSDLAVIKITADNLPLAKLGDSEKLKIGQWVVAIGNPFGYIMDNPQPSVTGGVISALHRSLGRTVSRQRDYSDLIQTDAAINPGNSGGPLVNLKGEVIGINVAIFSTSGGYQGIGFAIPVNTAKRIISQLISGEKVLYGWLGINIQDLNEDLAKYFSLTPESAVLVVKVINGSPAEKANIKSGDLISEFNGQKISSTRDLLAQISKTQVGSKVKVVLLREGKSQNLAVEIGQRPDTLEEFLADSPKEVASGPWRGLEVEDAASDVVRRRLGLDEKLGVAVVSLEPDSSAQRAGMVKGDIISEINKQPIKNISDYKRIIKLVKGDALVRTARGYYIVKQ